MSDPLVVTTADLFPRVRKRCSERKYKGKSRDFRPFHEEKSGAVRRTVDRNDPTHSLVRL